MSARDRRLADQALSAQYGFTQIREGNPWWGIVLPKFANVTGESDPVFVDVIRAMARQASTFAVSTDMTETVKHAAEDLLFQWIEGDTVPEVLLPYDLPTKSGFVHFAHHIELTGIGATDEDGNDLSFGVIGFMWHTDGQGGIMFVPVAARDFWRDRIPVEFDEVVDRHGQAPEYLAHDFCGWHFGKPWRVDPAAPLGQHAVVSDDGGRLFNPAAAADRAILWSFFRLVEQRIPVVHQVRPSRPVKRRVKAKPDLMTGVPDDGAVRLVTLRREQENDHGQPAGEGESHYSHRWVVEPHWARRRVAVRDTEGRIVGSTHGVEGADWIYRRVYIGRYVKGPEDRPLVLRDPVAILKR